MSREPLVVDANVIIRHGGDELARRGLPSSVVLQEIAAGARDAGEVREWGALGRALARQGRLLVPSGDDWFEAGRVLNSLMRGVRSARAPRSHAIAKGEQQRLVRDVLIARSARRANATVVTYNRADFGKIRRFCNVRLMNPEDFLE